MIKQSLNLKQGQSLSMTPQLQQAIRLLQLSSVELQQEIQEVLETNPLLERADEASLDSIEADSDQKKEEITEASKPDSSTDSIPEDMSIDAD